MEEMGNTPLVSVIIPTYNRGWILKEAIDSVLAQSYRNFELIVIDDGSTDNTPRILDRYRDELTVIRQENKGVSAARNTGIQASSGACIALLDSDDLWLEKKLEEQVDFFKKNPEAQICQTEEIWIRKGKRVNPKKRHKKPSGMIFEKSLHLCLVSPSAVMIKRDLLDRTGLFDEELPACEDYDLWLRISCEHPVYTTDSPLVVKRGGHEDQLSRAPGLDRFRIRAIEKVLESGKLNGAQYEAAAEVLREKCRIYAGGCCKRDRVEEARHFEEMAAKYATG